MATYKILYWQEIPSQIKADDGVDEVTVSLPPRFMERSTRSPPSETCKRRTTILPNGNGARSKSATVPPKK